MTNNNSGGADGQIIACGNVNTSGGAKESDCRINNNSGGANDSPCIEQTEGEPDERTTFDSGSSRAVTATAPHQAPQ